LGVSAIGTPGRRMAVSLGAALCAYRMCIKSVPPVNQMWTARPVAGFGKTIAPKGCDWRRLAHPVRPRGSVFAALKRHLDWQVYGRMSGIGTESYQRRTEAFPPSGRNAARKGEPEPWQARSRPGASPPSSPARPRGCEYRGSGEPPETHRATRTTALDDRDCPGAVGTCRPVVAPIRQLVQSLDVAV
jgi:hypothetical protein